MRPALPPECDTCHISFEEVWRSGPMDLHGVYAATTPGQQVRITLAPRGPSVAPPDRLDIKDLTTGAGLALESVRQSGSRMVVTARRLRSLADTVGPEMRILTCGLNPSEYAADAGVGYARPGNRFWPALREAGLTGADRDPVRALGDGVGMTDLVKRATVRASDLSGSEYREGLARVERLCARLRPETVCFVGLSGWRAAVDRRATAGWQDLALGGCRVYVMPSTSGLNAHASLDALAQHLRTAARGP